MSVGICVRIRRTRVEYAYVDVLVTDDLITPEGRLDGKAVMDRAAVIGGEPDVEWYPEATTIEVHPLQGPRGEGERAYYAPGHPSREEG
jgi:hypothetical protein